MVMLRPPGKAAAINKAVLKQKGVKTTPAKSNVQVPLSMPYLQH